MAFNISTCTVTHLGYGNLGHSYMMSGQTMGVTKKERVLGATVSKTPGAFSPCMKVARTARTVFE
jgi:hypothetical protein